ncbi:MAG: hypothetical protein Q8O72_01005 [Bacteroidales bacterium]|nr:hypothetical protein [Bacteroidales bacterium]
MKKSIPLIKNKYCLSQGINLINLVPKLEEIAKYNIPTNTVNIHIVKEAENIELDTIAEFIDYYEQEQNKIKKVIFLFQINKSDNTIALNLDYEEKSVLIILILESIDQNLKVETEIKKLFGVTEIFSNESIKNTTENNYIDISRLDELKIISSKNFDLTRLIRYCEELNIVAKNNCDYSTIMLVRAILDHIPPIFVKKKFIEVANSSPKSIKESLLNLENSSRKIADTALHLQIRQKEVLPNKTQINYKNDLDVLISEIVRLLK